MLHRARRRQGFEDLKGKTILIAGLGRTGYWLWLKAKYGFTDAQTRPYTFNIQPFVADKNTRAAGLPVVRAVRHPEGRRQGQRSSCSPTTATRRTPPPSSCMEKTVKTKPEVVARFVKATHAKAGRATWQTRPGNALIKKDNPNMTDDQLAYSVAKLRRWASSPAATPRSWASAS